MERGELRQLALRLLPTREARRRGWTSRRKGESLPAALVMAVWGPWATRSALVFDCFIPLSSGGSGIVLCSGTWCDGGPNWHFRRDRTGAVKRTLPACALELGRWRGDASCPSSIGTSNSVSRMAGSHQRSRTALFEICRDAADCLGASGYLGSTRLALKGGGAICQAMNPAKTIVR